MHLSIFRPAPAAYRWLVAAGTALVMLAAVLTAVTLTDTPAAARGRLRGLDVSHHQGPIRWSRVHKAGNKFAYIKATEGVGYHDPRFRRNYRHAHHRGLFRGAYHFALPNKSSGARQANYFINHGGKWKTRTRTLPGALDMEWNPYNKSRPCYGKSKRGMRRWVRAFLKRYHHRTGRWAVIYTTTSWWKQCTGNYAGFWDTCPLWIARYRDTPMELPRGARTWTFWQYTSTGHVKGVAGKVDKDKFHGNHKRLKALANKKK